MPPGRANFAINLIVAGGSGWKHNTYRPTMADLGQTVRRLKEELGEIHARAVRGTKIITNRLKPRRRLCCSFTELEMSQVKELEGVRQAEASKIKTVYVPRIGETD